MISSLMQRKFCSLRSSNFTSFTKSFNRQSKSSKWSLKRNDESISLHDSSSSNLGLNCLVKPFIFTCSFSGCCFVSATIWQYEEMRKLAHRFINNQNSMILERLNPGYKRNEIRRTLNTWWHNQGEGQKVASVIIAVNIGVFLLWRIKALQPFMTQYFCASPARAGSCLPMVLSTFSHYSFFHLAANMYVLYGFSNAAVGYFGKEQFMAVYGSAGVISSFTSYVYKVMSGRLVTSLGASGALMAILSTMCFQYPDIPLQIIFLPFFTFSAGHAIKAIMALDVVGLIAKWRLFDHAAHLGGATYGIIYLTYGRDYLWDKRENIFTWYHSIREKKK